MKITGGVWQKHLLEIQLAGKAKGTVRERYGALWRFVRFLAGRQGARRRPRVDALTKEALIAFYSAIVAGGAKPSSAKTVISHIRTAWRWASNHEEYGEVTPRLKDFEMNAPAPGPKVAPTWGQMDAVIGAAGEFAREGRMLENRRFWESIGELAMLMRCTGLRVSQVQRLLWEDFDLDQRLLTIRPALGKTKAEKVGRVIPIAPVLATWLEQLGRPMSGVVVAPHRLDSDDVRMDTKAASEALNAAWRRAEIAESVWLHHPCHTFRAGFVTGLKAAKADTEATEYLVGHKWVGERSRYLDPNATPLREAVGKVPPVTRGLALPFPKRSLAVISS